MKNYKINAAKDIYSYFGSKCFTEAQDKFLKINQFYYRDSLIKYYEKRYCYNEPYGNLDMRIMPNDEYLRFYICDYFLPCELEKKVGGYYKKVMKIMQSDIKLLKDIGVISK